MAELAGARLAPQAQPFFHLHDAVCAVPLSGECPAAQKGAASLKEGEAVFRGQPHDDLRLCLRPRAVAPEAVHPGAEMQGEDEAVRMRQGARHFDGLVAALQGLVRVAEMPERPGQERQAAHARVEVALGEGGVVGVGAVGVVQGHAAFQVGARLHERAEPERGQPERLLRGQESFRVGHVLGQCTQVFDHPAGFGIFPARHVEAPQGEHRSERLGDVAERPSQLARARIDPLDFGVGVPLGRHERHAERDQQRQFLLLTFLGLRQGREQVQGAGEVVHRLGVRRPVQRQVAGLLVGGRGAFRVAAAHGVVGQVPQPGFVDRVRGLGDCGRGARVQFPAVGRHERAVRHLLGQEMLEGVGHVGERGLFVDELRGLQPGQGRREVGLGFPGDATEQPEWKFAPDDGRGLKQVFLLAAEQVDTAGQHALHRVGNAQVVQGRGERHAAQPVRQDALVEQGADHLFDEERRALGLVQDEALERVEGDGRADRIPEQRVDQFPRVVHAQGVQPELAVVGLAAPVVAVARPVVGQQHDRGGRHAVGQRVEERLRLGVQPLQILEDQQQRAIAALAQQEPFDRVERALPADVGVHLLQGGDELRMAEQSQHVGQPVFQVTVERDHAAGHFFVQAPLVVLRLNAEVAAQEFDQRQIRGPAAVGLTESGEHEAGRFREQPEFVEQPRLAHARLTHHAHDLPASAARLFAKLFEVVDLFLAAHEARQPARRGHLQAGAQRPDPEHLVDVQRPADALDLGRAQIAELEIALGQLVGVLAGHDGAGGGEPFQPRGQAGGVADRHVIRVQVVLADGADHDRAAVHADADLQIDTLLAA